MLRIVSGLRQFTRVIANPAVGASLLAMAGVISGIAQDIVPAEATLAQSLDAQEHLTIEGPTAVEFPENSTAAIAAYRVTNGASDSMISWLIDGTDARRLSIDDSGVLRFTAARNFERPNDADRNNDYEIELSAVAGSTHVSVEVIVKVKDVNEPPAFELESAEFSVEENASGNRRVGGALVVIDPDDGDLRRFSLEEEHADLFQIDTEGQIRVRPGAILDYEIAGVLSLTVLVTDLGGLSDSLPVQIQLTDADDQGIVTFSSAKPFIGVSFNATVSDDDGVTGRIRWRWHRAADANSEFIRIDEANGNSYTPVENDEGYILRATVLYEDNFEVEASASGVSAAVAKNSLPEFDSTSITLTVLEEAPMGTDVGDPVSALDSDNDDLSYTLSGEDASYFEVDASSGQISVGVQALPDSEMKSSYTVIVTATDEAGAEASIMVMITVGVSNAPPVITGPATVDYTENGTMAVVMYYAADPDGDGITWDITGADASGFSIQETGELSFNSPPDYEKPRDANNDNVYEVTVTASDGNLTAELDVEITVTNINEALSIKGSTSVTYAENGTTKITVYSIIDSEGSEITWNLEGADAARFSISKMGELMFNSPPDYEKPQDANNNNVYEVTVTASDGNLTAELDIEITVTNISEAVLISGPTSVTYTENGATTVAVYSTTDSEGNEITWNLEGADTARFSIGEMGELMFNSPPDYEKPRDANTDNVYAVTLTASAGGLTSSLDIEITVTNVNEAASIRGSASVAYTENSTTGVAVYSATDPEGDTITWSVSGADASRFSIKETGELSFESAPDYEQPGDANKDNVYEVTVTASDGVLTSRLEIEITIANVIEALIIAGPDDVSYTENGTGSVATYLVTDLDGDGITWGVAGTDASRFSIKETGELLFNSASDYEKPRDANEDNVYEVRVTVSDGNLTAKLDIEVTVTNVNEVASIDGSTFVTYVENDTITVAVYSATDPDGDGITWGIEGIDEARFQITATGELSFDLPPDYEKPRDANNDNMYEVTVTASDGDLTAKLDIEVTVSNVNEAASIAGPVSVTYSENNTDTVAIYSSTDSEGDEIAWDIEGADAAHFVIDDQGGLAFVSPPNFENPLDAGGDNVYLVRIVVDDGSNKSGLDVVVDVTDANDAPRFPSKTIVTQIPENSCPGAYTIYRGIGGGVGSETDEDGDPLVYALSGQDGRIFVIHSPSGYVTLGPGTLLDFETSRKPFMLRVAVSDGRDDLGDVESEFAADDYLDLTVMVSDVDEPPVFTEAQLILDACGAPIKHESDQLRRTVTAGVRGGSRVGAALSVIDPERKPVHFRLVSQSDQGAFIVDSRTGQIMVAPGFSPRDARRVYTLRVAAMDGELESKIEVRIAVMKAPKPTPEPDVEDSSGPNPESANDAEALTPSQSNESSGDSSPPDKNAAHSTPTPKTLNRPPVDFKQVEPTFVPVPRAAQIRLFGSSEVQDQTGRARLIAPPGAFAVPYQVRLTQDEAACVPLNKTAPLLGCVCVSLEFFDVNGEPLVQESLNRPAVLEIVLRTQEEVGNSGSGDERVKIGHDSVEMMMRQDDEQEWGYAPASLREPADGSSILMTQVRSPGQYMALVTESRTDNEDLGSAAPLNSVKITSIQQTQKAAKKSALRRTVSFVYNPVAAHPEPEPAPLVSTEPQVWYMARLMIALLLDVTVALYVGFLLQRLTFRRR